MKPFLFALVLAVLPVTLCAQSPSADWRTVETAHFRVHYPADYEPWALRAASTLESVRERVGSVVGFTVAERIDVVVADPVAAANGSAWPIVGWPRIVLWTTPPSPGSQIGTGRDWIEMLAIHEQTHVQHLIRPSRNSVTRLLQKILPVGSIAWAPRWVSEGYATVVEGELTGAGRPNSDYRAMVLRRWAQMGRLPSYDQLDSDTQSWQGMSMAYLTGSAYLEWLQARTGPDSLKNLWARMTARRKRSFDEAFSGVFGDSPRALYDRFRAETTARAMNVETILAPTLREGELFQDLTWSNGGPAVSPDGKHLAVILRSRDEDSVITVWTTGPDEKAVTEDRERITKMIERDPQDVAPVRVRPLPRDAEWELALPNGMEPSNAEWLGDDALLFSSDEPDRDGFLHADLFEWTPSSGAVRRISRQADLREAHPHPDGRSAIAVRSRYGMTQLVSVDLITGAVSEWTSPRIEPVVSSPRFNHDGSKILYLSQERGRWRLFEMDAAGHSTVEIPTPEDAHVNSAVWGRTNDAIFAVLGRAGFLEIWRRRVAEGEWEQITRSNGASLEPAEGAERLFFLSLDANGLDVRTLPLDALEPLPPVVTQPDLFPVVRPAPVAVAPYALGTLEPSKPYGIGDQEMLLLAGTNLSPSGRSLEGIVRVGDLIGRLDTIVAGAVGEAGSERGLAISSVWRGFPVEIAGQLFSVEHDLSRQPENGVLSGDRDQTGGELRLHWRAAGRSTGWDLDAGVVGQRIDTGDTSTNEMAGFAGGRQRWSWEKNGTGVSEELAVRYQGEGGDTSGTILNGSLTIGAFAGDMQLYATIERGDSSAMPFVLGGTQSSLLPVSARASQVFSEALPIGMATGSNFERQRVDFVTGVLPFTLFFERARLWDDAASNAPWLRHAGLELSTSFESFPLLRIPGLSARVGAARILDGTLEDRTTWWLTMVWRP